MSTPCPSVRIMCRWQAPCLSVCACDMQMASFALGQLLSEEQRPFPMDMIHINDTRTDIVPNAGELVPATDP